MVFADRLGQNAALTGKLGTQRVIFPSAVPCYSPNLNFEFYTLDFYFLIFFTNNLNINPMLT